MPMDNVRPFPVDRRAAASSRHGRWSHNVRPDRRVVDSQAGDVLVHKRRQYSVLTVQRFNDWMGAWNPIVRECVVR